MCGHFTTISWPLGSGSPWRDGPRVAHRDVVANERADTRHCSGEVDRAEDDHARLGSVRLDAHGHSLAASLTVRAVVQCLGATGREQAARIGDDRRRRRGRNRATRDARVHTLGADDEPPAELRRVHVLHHGRDRDGAAGRDISCDPVELREARRVDRLDEYIENPAARQTHGERVFVAHPVALQQRPLSASTCCVNS
jgi:hypothetical protein